MFVRLCLHTQLIYDRFGIDSFEILYDGVFCDTASYLTVSQCRIMGRHDSDCFNDDDDLSVICGKFVAN